MIERAEDCLGLCPERMAADSAYGSAEMPEWLTDERAIEPHIPVFDKSARDLGRSRAEISTMIKKPISTSVRPGCKCALTPARGLFGCAAAVLRCPQAGG